MSEMQSYKGKIKIINHEPFHTSDYAAQLIKKFNLSKDVDQALDKYNMNIFEFINDADFYLDKEHPFLKEKIFYHIGKDLFFQYIEYEKRDECGWVNIHEESDGVLSFDTYFYNGGTCLSELIEDAIDKYYD